MHLIRRICYQLKLEMELELKVGRIDDAVAAVKSGSRMRFSFSWK